MLTRLIPLLLLLVPLAACDEEKREPENVRPAALAARGWYESDPDRLAKNVDALLDDAPEWKGGPPIALVAPHAGHRFAGPMQAAVFRSVRGRKVGRVFLLGVPHKARVRGASVPGYTHYATPLGEVPVDRATTRRLLARGRPFHTHAAAHPEEHSLEILLPFLQRAVPDLRIVPMLIGVDPPGVQAVADALREELEPGDLVVASSDNTHYGDDFGYHPFPTDSPDVAERLRKLDMGAVERILEADLAGYLRYRRETGITTCGFDPICVLLALLPAGAKGTVTGYDTSARVTGRWSSVVTYVGIAFTGAEWGAEEAVHRPLTEAEQGRALRLARDAVETWVRKRRRVDPAAPERKLDGPFLAKSGVFVTLKIRDDEGREHLRGCIGDILPVRPLRTAIAKRAVSSAAEDPRFRPVRPDELARIRIELSVLSPPAPVPSFESIEIGKHGIVLLWDGRTRSVYLPQVAPEQGWDRAETLTHLSRKGGLAGDAWKSERATFQVFTAQVFAEDE